MSFADPQYRVRILTFTGTFAIGPLLFETPRLKNLGYGHYLNDVSDDGERIALDIKRGGKSAFTGETRTSQIKRPLEELAAYLYMELDFPKGAFLSTGTGIVPGQDFSLTHGDVVAITVGGADGMTLENEVAGKSTSNQLKR